MAFMLISHGTRHLKLASDEGHQFLFTVVPAGRDRKLAVGGVEWTFGRQPPNSVHVLRHASRFASACAQDFGLL